MPRLTPVILATVASVSSGFAAQWGRASGRRVRLTSVVRRPLASSSALGHKRRRRSYRTGALLATTTTTTTASLSPGSGSTITSRDTSTTAPTTTTTTMSTLDAFAAQSDPSWVTQLSEDPEGKRREPNRSSREVKSGHYVVVEPMKLPDPKLVMFSPELMRDLGLDPAVAETDERFARFLSGDVDALSLGPTWATPYALSIMGEPMTHNCPFGNGNGYGDGRAVSLGEVVVGGDETTEQKRYELQLKGGGQTPFCRGADGRAVLRSSIREFLASEAMHFLGVPTTRALSLVVSESETVRRPWYSERSRSGTSETETVTEDDPRLAKFPLEVRRQLARQLSRAQGKRDPDVAILEPAAITTRVAPSFTRVGHLDLFARRAASPSATDAQRREHRMMVAHAIFREDRDLWSPTLVDDVPKLRAAAIEFARRVAERLASLAGEWLRVGFTQGNFNADNCLVGGRTMDYGPFGFVDEYDPGFAKWVGSGDHFAFAAQPTAARANFATLARALVPLFDAESISKLKTLVEDESGRIFQRAATNAYRKKLGLEPVALVDAADDDESNSSQGGRRLWERLEPVLRRARCDYTIFFRELSRTPGTADAASLLSKASYLDAEDRDEHAADLDAWLADWRAQALPDEKDEPDDLSRRMLAANPKYVLREWMLVDAYEAASRGDFSVAKTLHRLVKTPYDEHDDLAPAYYRKADARDLAKPGTAFMT